MPAGVNITTIKKYTLPDDPLGKGIEMVTPYKPLQAIATKPIQCERVLWGDEKERILKKNGMCTNFP